MKSSRAQVLAGLLLSLWAAGCGGGDGDSGPGPANVSGTWIGRQSGPGGEGNVTLVLQDTAGTVRGTKTYQQTGYVSAFVPAQSAKTSAVSGTYDAGSGTLILSFQAPSSIFIEQYVYTVSLDGTMVLSSNSGQMPGGGNVNVATQSSTLQLQN